MATQKFDKGHKVKLESGGPQMTVKGYKALAGIGSNPKESDTDVICNWFDGTELKQRTFHQDELQLDE